MSSAYERLNLAQSVTVGPHGKLVRLVSRIAMLTIEIPAAMGNNDWPEQRRVRGDLDEAIARLRDEKREEPDELQQQLEQLTSAGDDAIAAILMTPRGSPAAVERARAASARAVAAADAIAALLNQSGAPPQPLLDS